MQAEIQAGMIYGSHNREGSTVLFNLFRFPDGISVTLTFIYRIQQSPIDY